MATKNVKSVSSKRAVVVTTAHKGIFFGYVRDDSQLPKQVTLEQCRNCVYFAANVKGFLGLAVTGPLDGSRVGPAAPEVTLYEVTSIVACSEAAIKEWESGRWS